MTAIPTKLYEAFEKIRLGKVEEGTRLFDRVDGFEYVKAIPLAELSYFRHDWKRGMQFSFDFLASETDLETNRYFSMRNYEQTHLELILVATCQLDCWKENRKAIEELKKMSLPNPNLKNNYDKYQVVLSQISDPINTTRRLTESKPKLRTKPILRQHEKELDLSEFESRLHHRRTIYDKRKKDKEFCDSLAREAFNRAVTEVHIAFYEKYIDRLEFARSHYEAAKSYIALDNLLEAKDAIRQYMRCWEFKEPFQVAPIELFADPELWTIMSDRRFTESLLTIPHHRES